MQLLIVGTGYVGLVTGACFAEMGLTVTCLDIDEQKINGLNAGLVPIYEPGLEEIVKRNAKSGRLKFTTKYPKNVDVCFLAVPTPAHEDGSCDVTYVFQAAGEVLEHNPDLKLLVMKSTVPVGTCTALKAQFKVDVVSNPEFLKEGSAISDCMKPDRIIIGAETPFAIQTMREIYASFTINRDRIIFMDIPSAEMTKYAANAMLASRISFMNEMAGLCEKLGANINDVRIGIGSDVRIGTHFLYAGVGFGGSCFPKDIRALQTMAAKASYETPLLDAVVTINQRQKQLLLKKIKSHFGDNLQNKTFAIWGLAFKPDTDDLREAPALELIRELLHCGARLNLYDPVALAKAKLLLKNDLITWCNSEYDAAKNADAVVLVTEWKQFRFVDFEKILERMQGRVFFDGRNQYKKNDMKERGMAYYGIGIPDA